MHLEIRKIPRELASQAKFAAQGLDFSVAGPGPSQEVRILASAVNLVRHTLPPLDCGSLICNVAGLF